MSTKALAASIFGIALAGCGGGSGGADSPAPAQAPAPAPDVRVIPQGFYTGTTSNGGPITGLVLDDGTYYLLYSSANSPTLIAGVVQGSGTALNGSFSSTNGKDINFEGAGVRSATVSASYVLSSTLNGSLTYPSSNQTLTFTSTYDKRYEIVPSLSTIAGTYSGQGGSPMGVEDVSLTVSPSGAISGRGSGGCNFSGTVASRSKGNAYDATIAFEGSPCHFPNTTVTGGAYFDPTTTQLNLVGLTMARDAGIIFSGVKQ